MTPLKTANARADWPCRGHGPFLELGEQTEGKRSASSARTQWRGAGEAALEAEARGCCHRGWVDAAQSPIDTANLSGVRSRHLQMWAPLMDGDKVGMRRTIRQRRGRDKQQRSPRSPSISNFPAPCEAPFWRPPLDSRMEGTAPQGATVPFLFVEPLPPLPVDGVRGGWPPPPHQVQWGM